MRKILPISIILILTLTTTGLALTPKESMHNSLGHAYKRASNGETEEAITHFREAARFAEKAGEWSGLIEAGNGLSALGDPKMALKYFNKALKISQRKSDWRGCIACGYAYTALPQKIARSLPYEAFARAGKIALKLNDWRGLIEAAKGIYELNLITPSRKYKKRIISITNSAYKIALDQKSLHGLRTAGKLFRMIGDYKHFKECLNAASKIEGVVNEVTTPPPGWKAYGETIAMPPRIDAQIQALNKQFADMDIKAKQDWIARQEIEEQRKRAYSDTFRVYYTYPSMYDYYGDWYPLNRYQLYNWSRGWLGHYRYMNDVYMYID